MIKISLKGKTSVLFTFVTTLVFLGSISHAGTSACVKLFSLQPQRLKLNPTEIVARLNTVSGKSKAAQNLTYIRPEFRDASHIKFFRTDGMSLSRGLEGIIYLNVKYFDGIDDLEMSIPMAIDGTFSGVFIPNAHILKSGDFVAAENVYLDNDKFVSNRKNILNLVISKMKFLDNEPITEVLTVYKDLGGETMIEVQTYDGNIRKSLSAESLNIRIPGAEGLSPGEILQLQL